MTAPTEAAVDQRPPRALQRRRSHGATAAGTASILQRHHRGGRALPPDHPVRPQLRGRARSHGVRGARTGDPRLLRPHQPGLPDPRSRSPRSAGSSSRSRSPTTPTGSTGFGSRCSARRCGPCSACSPGFATTILMLVIARSGAGMGRAVVTPTHNSLLSDYYPIEVRAEVFGFHRMANALGAFIGPVVGGLLAEAFGWRVPFFVFVIPSIVFVVLGMRLAGARAVATTSDGRPERPRRSSPPTRSRRRGPSRSASSGRSARCAGSGSRCRSSPHR